MATKTPTPTTLLFQFYIPRSRRNHLNIYISENIFEKVHKRKVVLTGPLTCPGMLGHSDSTQLCRVRRTRGRALFEPSGIHARLGQLPPADALLKMFGAGKNPLP